MKHFGFGTYIFRNIIHHRQLNSLLLAGTVITSAVISGSFILGDSVRQSLKNITFSRIGHIRWSMYTGDRFISSGLAETMSDKLAAPIVQAIVINGTASAGGGSLRVNNVQISGVDEKFPGIFGIDEKIDIPPGAAIILSA